MFFPQNKPCVLTEQQIPFVPQAQSLAYGGGSYLSPYTAITMKISWDYVFSESQLSRSQVTGADVLWGGMTLWHTCQYARPADADVSDAARQGGSCRQRAHAYWSATAKPLSFSVSAVLRLPLRPRVPQTDVRWAAARVEWTSCSPHSTATPALFSAFFPTYGGKGGSDVGWGGGRDHIPYWRCL